MANGHARNILGKCRSGNRRVAEAVGPVSSLPAQHDNQDDGADYRNESEQDEPRGFIHVMESAGHGGEARYPESDAGNDEQGIPDPFRGSCSDRCADSPDNAEKKVEIPVLGTRRSACHGQIFFFQAGFDGCYEIHGSLHGGYGYGSEGSGHFSAESTGISLETTFPIDKGLRACSRPFVRTASDLQPCCVINGVYAICFRD